MKMNDFNKDLEYSLDINDSEMFDALYYKVFEDIDRIEVVTDMKQQKKGIDKIIYLKNGKTVTVDEKKRRSNYNDILLELWSVYEWKKEGWLFTDQCDFIVYAIVPASKAYFLPTLLLRKAWADHKVEWLDFANKSINGYSIVNAQNEGYTTVSIAIPSDILLSAISQEMKQEIERNNNVER